MEFRPANLVAPAIRITAAGLGGALGGALGNALGAALGIQVGAALGKEAVDILTEIGKGFGDESARKLCELGGDSLAERLKPSSPVLHDLYRKALHLSLQRIRPFAPAGSGLWFEHWNKCLDSSQPLHLEPIRLDQLTPETLNALLPRTLSLLDAQGSGSLVPRDLPPDLLGVIAEHLPKIFPQTFQEFIVQDKYAQAWKQAELEFRDVSIVLLRSIKQDTALLPGMDAKLNTLLAYLLNQPSEKPARKPFNLLFATLGDLFKGRESDMEELEKQLKKSGSAAIVQPASITGMGGIGKTRLAIEYALHHQQDFSALLFVSANTPQELGTNFALLSGPEALDLPEYGTGRQPEQYDAVFRWFQQNEGWLLVLDNVDTKEAVAAVQHLVPKLHNGQVLITSRISTWGGATRSLDLDLLSEEAAAAYLLEKTAGHRQPQPGDEPEARELAQELGLLALALEQAAAYINARSIALAEYRRRWQQSSEKLIGFHDDVAIQYPRTVAVTYNTSFEQLSANARRLLNILAWLAPEPVPRSLLEADGGPFAAEDEDGLPEDDWPGAMEEAEDALAELVRFSLASWSADKTTFSVHRLVQTVTRRSQPAEEQTGYVVTALRWVNAGFAGDPSDVRSWPALEPLAGHAHSVATEADHREIVDPTTRLMNQLGVFYKSRAEWSQAEPLYRRALDIAEKSAGGEHPDVVSYLTNLAALLYGTNRIAQAEPLMRHALAIDEKNYGPDHPVVATDLNNLAQLLQGTNRLAEAEPLMRRALAIDKKRYGPDHPNVAICLNNLAILLHHTNRQVEAEPLYRRALAIDQKSYGPDHPNVAIRLNNLAQLLQDTNRLDEAEPLMRRALDIDQGGLAPDHPNVATSLNNLARLLQATNRPDEAEPLFRRTLAIDKKRYGPDHSEVARDLNNFANLLQTTNRPDEAEPIMRRVIEIFRNITHSTGHLHPHMQNAINNYTNLLEEMGMSEEQILARLHELAPDFFPE
jgi:tetratricopeptide (TPR) repeat protein